MKGSEQSVSILVTFKKAKEMNIYLYGGNKSEALTPITDDNEVFVYGGVPLDSANRGPLGPVLSDLWVFNSTCPATLPVLQPLNVEKWSPSPPAEVTSEPAGQLRVFSMNSQ